ncbi:uncharacterized protein LOC127724932 [Mytilus californianus]|uniref:uncharacterized protein LOC127724932 n=1 Tax=Mytilus californianus TaxID=6549 RepID=UPI0022478E63|nr:uncharacterized protein LOC127724932 [Mytilus californianus]
MEYTDRKIFFTAILGISIVCICIWKFRGNISKLLPQEEANFLRIYLLSQKHATDALRYVFDTHVPKSLLTTHLGKYSTFYWRKDESIILFPVSGGQVKSTDFDSSLLYKLIRNTLNHKIAAPTRGWGSTPLSGDKSEADDIERIRSYRNKIAHNTEFKISNKQYQDQWNELSQAVNRLSQETLKTEITALECTQFNGSQKNEIASMQRNISKMKDEVYELQNELFTCQDEITEIQDAVIHSRKDIDDINERHIPRHIRKCQLTLLEDWKRHDILFCDETRGYKAAYVEANKHNTVTFIGGPGSGKTATARHIALLFERLGWEVVPVCKEEEIIRYGNCNIRQVFVLDDILGVFALDMTRFNNVASSEKSIIRSLSNSKSKLLLTCRKTVYNEAIVLKPFVFENIVDLESMNNELNELEKMKIIKTHCSMAAVDEKAYTNLSLTNAKLMFPFLCQLFAVNVKYQMIGSKFFAMPFEILLGEMSKLHKTNTAQYASLVLCLVNNKQLSINNMPSKQIKKRIYNACGLDRGTADRKIFDALSNIKDTFVVKFENEYSFIHNSIYETVAYHYGQEFPEHILEFMPSNFIANNSFDDLNIMIKERDFFKLAERLYLDLESDKLFDVFMNKALKYQSFLSVFFQLIRKKSYEAFKITFLTPSTGNCEHMVDYEDKAGRTYEDMYRDETIRRELLTDKRVREQNNGVHGNDVTHTIRLISWVVYYGHTCLLQEIVEHVHDHNDSTDIVFGSNIEEQARLLLLSVYNGDPCLMELIIKYVKTKSIGATPMYMSDTDYLNENYHRTLDPLNAACHYGNLQIVKLLVQSGVNVNCCEYHEFPLSVATENGYNDIVKYLAENGADVNAFKPSVSITDASAPPLYIASAYGYSAIANCLVQNGADVNKDMFSKRTPLFEASSGGFKDIVKILVENGADVNFCDYRNKSPLFTASKAGHSDIVSYLVKSDSDINLCDMYGRSPLLASIETGHFEVVQILINNNCRINTQVTGNILPLTFALMQGNVEITTYLIQNGADYNMQNEYGVTSLQLALWKNHTEILQQIISLENEKGPTPYSGNWLLYELLVDMHDFKVFPETISSTNMYSEAEGRIYINYSEALLTFICKCADEDYLKHLYELGLGSNYDAEKEQALLFFIIITNIDVTKRVEKVKSLLDVGISSHVRNQVYVFLLKHTITILDKKKTVLGRIEFKWKNNPTEMFCKTLSQTLGSRPNSIPMKNLTDYHFEVEEYSSIMSLLKQRTRRLSIRKTTGRQNRQLHHSQNQSDQLGCLLRTHSTLQEIVNHVQDNNESTDLVFGSNIEEQARLLLLSVHYGDPGLIELILKYVKTENMSASSMYMCDDFVRANHHRTSSPLTAACRSGSLRIVELLIRSGADFDH